ncbi:hypothetical protein DEJ17_04535 [Curtobacterium sp. MCSS17_011]|nr:hypothetical protein DEJ17_04535 [Curtobacterium sp. MCSS17_011]
MPIVHHIADERQGLREKVISCRAPISADGRGEVVFWQSTGSRGQGLRSLALHRDWMAGRP